MIYYVDRCLAGIGTVAGTPYVDRAIVWPDDIYPYRVKVKPTLILPRDSWIPVDESIKAKLKEHLGNNWVLHAIRGLRPIPVALFEYLRGKMMAKAGVAQEEPPEEFKAVQREAQKQVEKRDKEPASRIEQKVVEQDAEELIGTAKEVQSHDRTQWYLIKLGRALGCDVWVARNDQGKSYKGEAFADLCLKGCQTWALIRIPPESSKTLMCYGYNRMLSSALLR